MRQDYIRQTLHNDDRTTAPVETRLTVTDSDIAAPVETRLYHSTSSSAGISPIKPGFLDGSRGRFGNILLATFYYRT